MIGYDIGSRVRFRLRPSGRFLDLEDPFETVNVLPLIKYHLKELGADYPAMISLNGKEDLDSIVNYFSDWGFDLVCLQRFSFADETDLHRMILINRDDKGVLDVYIVGSTEKYKNIDVRLLIVPYIEAIDPDGRSLYTIDPLKVFPSYFYEVGLKVLNWMVKNKERFEEYKNLLYL